MKNLHLLDNDQREYVERILADKNFYKKNLHCKYLAIVFDYATDLHQVFTLEGQWGLHNEFYDIVEYIEL